MYHKFRLVKTPQCDCRERDQTAEHTLQHCRLTEELRKRVWQVPLSLDSKLYGTKEDLVTLLSLLSTLEGWCRCIFHSVRKEGRKEVLLFDDKVFCFQ